jgi:hypothetical protein
MVIRYSPPKSQIWGHQVGRLSAVSVVERVSRFLDAHATVLKSQASDLTIEWSSSQDAAVAGVAAEMERALGLPKTGSEMPAPDGRVYRHRCWQYQAELLPAVAAWFDRLADLMKARDVFAQASTSWLIAWRDEGPPRPTESTGGMFGIHLGRPHRLTTAFDFRNLEQYAKVKAALRQLQLVELSDKHLRPRIGTDAVERGSV